MKDLQLTILKKEDLKRRYENLRNSQMAHLTNEAVENGYSIAILSYPGLKYDYAEEWLRHAKEAIASHFKGKMYKIGTFTDLSKVENDKVCFSFKTKKEDIPIAHSLSGQDSEGFIYN